MKLKLQKNNTLSKTIKKSNFKPKKFRSVVKKTGTVLFIADGTLLFTNFFNITNLENIEKVLSSILCVILGYLGITKVKQIIDIASSNARLMILSDQLSACYNIKVSIDDLRKSNLYTKDEFDLIPLSDNDLIIESTDQYDNVQYSYYKDGDYTDISELVNNIVLTMRQRKRKNKQKKTDDDTNQDYPEIKGFLD